jgi:hypothetical protein
MSRARDKTSQNLEGAMAYIAWWLRLTPPPMHRGDPLFGFAGKRVLEITIK